MQYIHPLYRFCIFVTLSIMFYLLAVFTVGYLELDKRWNK